MTVGMQQTSEPGAPAVLASWTRPVDPEVGAGQLALAEAMRELQDRVAAVVAPDDVLADVTAAVRALADRLSPHVVAPGEQAAGRILDRPGCGQTMIPPVELDELGDEQLAGRVTFGRFYLGGNAAAHGGAVPLVIDAVMGRLAHAADRTPARTAYLRVDYRSITPVERELQIRAAIVSEEGRKRILVATLHDGERLCAEAEALFVELRPGQA